MRLAGPLDYEKFHRSIVRIADEFNVRPSSILSIYIIHRNQGDSLFDEEILIHDISRSSFTLSIQPQ
jgi:hypothetical protein